MHAYIIHTYLHAYVQKTHVNTYKNAYVCTYAYTAFVTVNTYTYMHVHTHHLYDSLASCLRHRVNANTGHSAGGGSYACYVVERIFTSRLIGTFRPHTADTSGVCVHHTRVGAAEINFRTAGK